MRLPEARPSDAGRILAERPESWAVMSDAWADVHPGPWDASRENLARLTDAAAARLAARASDGEQSADPASESGSEAELEPGTPDEVQSAER